MLFDNFLYPISNMLFGPLSALSPIVAVVIVSLTISFSINLVYKFFSRGESVKKIRQEMKISRNDLAEKAGISHRSLCYAEDNNGNPSLKTLSKIANALGKKITEILE